MKMMNQLIEYIKIHRISLIQDREKLEDLPSNDASYNYITGAIVCMDHLLSVAEGMIE
jgi:hypothetical protein